MWAVVMFGAVIIVPLALAAAVALALSRRDRRRWDPGAQSVDDSGRGYRDAMGEAGNARNSSLGGGW